MVPNSSRHSIRVHLSVGLALSGSVLAGFSSCVSYEPDPIDPRKVLAEFVAEYDAPFEAATDDISLREAVALMLQNNPRIVAARGVFREARAAARIETPLANPTLGIGPVILSGGGSGFEAALGWLIPLSGRRAILDDRNRAEARAAEATAVIVAREEYLELRADLLALTVQADRLAIEREIGAAMREIVDGQKRLGAQATLSAVDIQLLELEVHGHTSEIEHIEADLITARGRLAARCGVAPVRIRELPARVQPELPEDRATLDQLRELLPEHPSLARIRARFEVAEQQLRLEVQQQYPDLELGGGFEREEGRSRLALPLGISLPIFDRNAGGIAKARAARETLRAEYRATMREKLNELAVALDALGVQHERFRALDAQVSRLTTSIRSLINASVSAGTMDAAQRAIALRKLQAAREQQISARADLYAAWLRLEKSCGAPLLRFPGEPEPPATENMTKDK